MGNCCGSRPCRSCCMWVRRQCCCCFPCPCCSCCRGCLPCCPCCSCCCEEEKDNPKKPLLQGLPVEEGPVFTVRQDPSGKAEVQEMKVDLPEVETREERSGHTGSSSPKGQREKPSPKSSTPPEVPSHRGTLVQGVSRQSSWKLIPSDSSVTNAPRPEQQREVPSTATAEAVMEFEETEGLQVEPRNIVLLPQEIEEEGEGEVEVRTTFSIFSDGTVESK